MTYLAFLLLFLLPPAVALCFLLQRERRRGARPPPSLRSLPASTLVGVHVVIALVYTIPWDSYMIATKVWTYGAGAVLFRIGYIPIEEYIFFVVQALVGGGWLIFLSGRVQPPRAPFVARPELRKGSVLVAGVLWLLSAAALLGPWRSLNYLALILIWALPPLMLQCAVGADILWHYRRLVGRCIVTNALYWAIADTAAIMGGTWTISHAQSTGLMVWHPLPVEEFVFFVVTVSLLIAGITLGMAQETRARLLSWLRRVL